MGTTRHLFQSEADMPRMLDLIRSMPISYRHILDFPWRFCAPSLYEGRDALFWENDAGQVVGLAAWQYYWAVLDFFILPGPEMSEVEEDLFLWADQLFRERDELRGQSFLYWIDFRDDDQERRHLVEAHGFVVDERDRSVWLEHTLADLEPVPDLPEGFVLRTLAGTQDVAAYTKLHRAAFGSGAMTLEWRVRSLLAPLYNPDLDLLLCTADGLPIAFCLGWYDPKRHQAQIEPIGVHPRFRRRGFGRILLLEMLRRFQELGADLAVIEITLERVAARHACTSVGFQQVHTIRCQGKWASQIFSATDV